MKTKTASNRSAKVISASVTPKSRILAVVAVFLIISGAYISRDHFRPVLAAIEEDTDESVAGAEAYEAAAASAIAAPQVKYQVSSSTPQFVVLSFDGSKSIEILNKTLDFEQKMQAEGKPLRFTYFINAAYFLTKDNAALYQAPGQERGMSKIGFSTSTQDIATRVRAFNTAFAMGNEIGSHSVGHFDGASWTYDQWKQEFDSFNSLMERVQQNNPSVQIDTPFFVSSIHGFRAPNLGVNNHLYSVLADEHFTYDASGVGKVGEWPFKDAGGIWHIPLGTIFIGPKKHPITAMDYNLWKYQSGAKDRFTAGTPAWNSNLNEVEEAYMDYFNRSYNGNRAPIIIGHHFSKWNDSEYWEAMKAFAQQVCGQPQVRCVTFKDLVDYLNANGTPPVAGR